MYSLPSQSLCIYTVADNNNDLLDRKAGQPVALSLHATFGLILTAFRRELSPFCSSLSVGKIITILSHLAELFTPLQHLLPLFLLCFLNFVKVQVHSKGNVSSPTVTPYEVTPGILGFTKSICIKWPHGETGEILACILFAVLLKPCRLHG